MTLSRSQAQAEISHLIDRKTTTAEGQAKKESLLATYERFGSVVEGWGRE